MELHLRLKRFQSQVGLKPGTTELPGLLIILCEYAPEEQSALLIDLC